MWRLNTASPHRTRQIDRTESHQPPGHPAAIAVLGTAIKETRQCSSVWKDRSACVGSHRKVRLLDSDIEGSATFETSGNVDSMTQCKLPEDVMFL